MNIGKRRLDGLWDIHVDPARDSRGFMFKAFDAALFTSTGFNFSWKQILHSYTAKRNTVRGIYIQTPPFTEGKLVTCLRGRSYWVVVDLRRASATFGQWEGIELSGDSGHSVLIAPGFGHGCASLTDDVDLLLLADNLHSDEHGVGIAWNDPEININWPLSGDPILSPAHARFPSFAAFRDRVGGI